MLSNLHSLASFLGWKIFFFYSLCCIVQYDSRSRTELLEAIINGNKLVYKLSNSFDYWRPPPTRASLCARPICKSRRHLNQLEVTSRNECEKKVDRIFLLRSADEMNTGQVEGCTMTHDGSGWDKLVMHLCTRNECCGINGPLLRVRSSKTRSEWTLTTMLLIVNLSSTRGLDGGALQLARSTSPGSYRSRSVHSNGRFCGSSAMRK